VVFYLYFCDMNKYICKFCNSEFESNKRSKNRIPLFCSIKCYGESLKMNKPCILCGKIIENKHSGSLKHRKYCSKECQSKARQNVPLSVEWKKALSDGRKNSEKCKGKNLYNWKGGKETELIRFRTYNNKRRTLLNKKIDVLFLEKLISISNKSSSFNSVFIGISNPHSVNKSLSQLLAKYQTSRHVINVPTSTSFNCFF